VNSCKKRYSCGLSVNGSADHILFVLNFVFIICKISMLPLEPHAKICVSVFNVI